MASPAWPSYLRPHRSADVPVLARLAIALASGVILSFSFHGQHPAIYSWFSLALLLSSILGARARVAFLCGFLHGLFFVLTCVSWIAEVLSVHGGMSAAAGWAVLLLIAVIWGASIGLFTWMVQRLSLQSYSLALFGAPFLWISTEVLRAYLPEISFPRGLLGYPAAGNPAIAQATTLTGIYGVSFMVAAFNALLVWSDSATETFSKRRVLILAGACVAILLVILAGPPFVPRAQAHHVARVLQTNFPENLEYPGDWYVSHEQDLRDLERLSMPAVSGGARPDLLIWPEAPAPFSFQDPRFGPFISRVATEFGGPTVVGIIEWKPILDSTHGVSRTGLVPYNSAAMVDAEGQRRFSYDKIHLVPFGEYEPFPLIHQVVNSVSEEVGGFRKGSQRNVGKFANGQTFSVFICYEAIYADEVREFARNGAQLLINISNDGWFGTSDAAEQHLRMARIRAVENRRWILRDTNSGITASIDPYGNVMRVMKRDTRGAADIPYDFRADQTIYTRFGDWFAWMCVGVSAILVLATFRKAKGNKVSI